MSLTKEFIESMGYYVYHHYDKFGNLRYIGEGHGKRAWALHKRNSYWKNVFRNELPTVSIVCWGMEESNALKLEALHVYLAHLKHAPITNLRPGGVSTEQSGGRSPMYGRSHSAETREKIAKTRRCKKATEETRKKLSEINLGKKLSLETRKKISNAFSGSNNPNFGKKFSEDTIRKMREAKLGKRLSEEHKKNMHSTRVGMLGKKHSDETKSKISKSLIGKNNPNFGKKLSKETIAKRTLSRRNNKSGRY